MTTIRYSFVFICQKGDLEIKSLLLALSLIKYLRVNYELIAAIPEMFGKIEYPSTITIDILKKNNVRIEIIKNTYLNNLRENTFSNRISNKIYCLNIPFNTDKIIFLDSDILCINPFEHNNLFERFDFLAKQANAANKGNWDEIYALFNMKKPDRLVKCTIDKAMIPPYFSSGFFIINKENAQNLFNTWLEVFIKLSESEIAKQNRLNHINQISLAISIQLLQLNYEVINEKYNFSINIKPISKNNYPYFAHYSIPLFICVNSNLKKLVNEFCITYPDIITLIKSNDEWNKVFFSSQLYIKYQNIKYKTQRGYNKFKSSIKILLKKS